MPITGGEWNLSAKKICPVCHTENSGEFLYCKRCGARLPDETSPYYGGPGGAAGGQGYNQGYGGSGGQGYGGQPYGPGYGGQPYGPGFGPGYGPEYTPPDYQPTDSDATAAFVGAANAPYAQKILNMKATGKKNSWNWPVFVFGLFLGTPFTWFFYRKMYKKAWIIAAICVTLSIASMGCFFGTAKPVFDAISDAAVLGDDGSAEHVSVALPGEGAPFAGETDPDDPSVALTGGATPLAGETDPDDLFDEDFARALDRNSTRMTVFTVLTVILGVARIVLTVFLAIRADRMYADFSDEQIEALRASGRFNALTIHITGGTSTGIAVGVTVGYAVLAYILAAVVSNALLYSAFGGITDALFY